MAIPDNYENLPMDWVGDWAGRRAAVTPHRPALLDADSGTRLTFAEVDTRACRTAAWLSDAAGIGAGEAVCVLARNRLELIDLYMACGKTGALLAPLSHRLRPPELNDLLERIAPRALVYEAHFDELVAGLSIPASVHTRIRLEGDDDSHLIQAEPPGPVNRPLAQADPFLYIHTGGTTATPKVCVIPHRQMIWNALDMIVTGGTLMEHRQLVTFPFFHIGGWNSFNAVFHAGGFSVITRQFDPGQLLELIPREGITHFGGVEAMLRFITRHPAFPDADLGSLRAITSAGAPCSDEAMAPFYARGIPVAQAYGLTEAGPSNFMYNGVDQDLDTIRAASQTIGTSMLHCDYRIVHREGGEAVPRGAVGVLQMRSPHNFGGYLGQPGRTDETLREGGWIHTGDLAVEDDAGNVRIVGRADNMFITGGENVSPEEIERVLEADDTVAQACVVAVPDTRWGQVPVAAVVMAPGAGDEGAAVEALTARCKEALAAYKVPRRIVVREALPVTGAGKIDRNALRDDLETA